MESVLVDNIGCAGERMIDPRIPLTFSLTERIDSEYHYQEQEYCRNGGCAIAFNQQRLDCACDGVVRHGVSLRLVRCYYEGKDTAEITALCEAFWLDQVQNIERLIKSNYCDEESGRAILIEICSIAPHFKRKKFDADNEWRIVMVSRECDKVNGEGFRASGLRDNTLHCDLINLMEGVAVRRCAEKADTMRELSRFALQQRNNSFKVWV